jgi:uncharacterized protein YaaQ
MGRETDANIMKMVMAVVPKKYGENLLSDLVHAGFSTTFYETRGGMLRQSQLTMLTAVKDDEVSKILNVIKSSGSTQNRHIYYGYGLKSKGTNISSTDEIQTRGGVVIFIWSLDQFELS